MLSSCAGTGTERRLFISSHHINHSQHHNPHNLYCHHSHCHMMITEGDTQAGGRIWVQKTGGSSPCHQKSDGRKGQSGQWLMKLWWWCDDNMIIGDDDNMVIGKLRLWWYDGKGEQTMMMTTRTLKPDRGKASRRTLRSRRQWQSETERQWQSEESRSALLDPTPLKMWDPTGSYPTQNKKWTVHCSAPNLPRSETPQVPLEGQSKPQQRLQITLKMIVWLPPPPRFNWLLRTTASCLKRRG